MTRRRLDLELVRRGLADSRASARALVAEGRVTVGGAPADKAARLVDGADALAVAGPRPRFVSRGGEKLAGALDRWQIEVDGARALDVGASTGGFTDCLLQHGAATVVAVDVGRGQLHERLRVDPRVVVRERTHIRDLGLAGPATIGGPAEIVVADLAFISLTKVVDALAALSAPGAVWVLLVKPQFEAGRAEASKGRGVISDPTVWTRVVRAVMSAVEDVGGVIMGVMESPLRGADGNVEFLLAARLADPSADSLTVDVVDVDAVVASIRADR